MTQTLLVIPSKSAKLAIKARVLKAQFGDGYKQTTPDGINNIPDSWDVAFNNMSEAQATSLESFFAGHKGTTPFFWSPLGRAQALYTCEEWGRTYNEEDAHSVTAKIERFYG